MAEVVVMPQLGNTVESCLVTSWHVRVGGPVTPNTIVADIETDKSAMEVPAGVAGTILALLAEPGDEVPVKAPFFIVGEPGEDISALLPHSDAEVPAQPETPAPEAPPSPEPSTETPPEPAVPSVIADQVAPVVPVQPPAGSSPASPRARRVADEAGVDISQVTGSGPHGRILESDVRQAIAAKTNPAAFTSIAAPELTLAAMPSFKPVESVEQVESDQPRTRGAEALPLTWVTQGTGIGGRVTRQDIENAPQETTPAAEVLEVQAPDIAPVAEVHASDIAQAVPVAEVQVPDIAQAAPPHEVSDEEFPGAFTDTPLAGIRKLVAERMLASMAAHAQLTFDASAPATALLELRAKLKASDPSLGMNQVTIGDLVAYAAVRVASKFSSINATYKDKVLRSFDNVHLGLAVDTPRGLLVPTIRFASAMGLREFSAQSKALAAMARAGGINPDLLAGATFTVTNLGAFGIESFTPILNSPQTAILGVNAILPRPVINPDGSVGVEQRISFSLTVDHAVVDGADAARFLQALVSFISTIDLAIMAEGGIYA